MGISVYDVQAQPLLSNEAFTRILGGGEASVQQGSPLTEILARAVTGEPVTDLETEWQVQGSPQRAQVSAFPVRDGATVIGVVVVVVDSSAERGQRETIGIVGHDLRNPLAAIRMTAQLLSKPDEMSTERRLTLSKRILTSSNRMDSILKSLLDYARAKAGTLLRLERETVDLGAIAARVIEEQTANLTGRSIELRTAGDLTGQWDPGRLEQILGQLISNAVRHGADGTSVLTLSGSAPEAVEITLHSRGPAIAPELLPHIFDAFAIGPRPDGTPRRSIGLGLFVVRELARAHGGRVAVESSDEGGTRFTVTLPRGAVTAT